MMGVTPTTGVAAIHIQEAPAAAPMPDHPGAAAAHPPHLGHDVDHITLARLALGAVMLRVG